MCINKTEYIISAKTKPSQQRVRPVTLKFKKIVSNNLTFKVSLDFFTAILIGLPLSQQRRGDTYH